jgi:ketosteroid isomerase-like protein
MKTNVIKSLILVILFLSVYSTKAQTQATTSNHYRDNVVDNPNAESDIKIVGDYLRLLVSGDLDKAKSLLAVNYKGYGPSPTDSTTTEQTINEWTQISKTRTNQKVSFYTTTFRVTTGITQGDWVSVWGDYNFTEKGKDIKLPFQFTAHLTGGKIDFSNIYYDRLYPLQILGYKLTAPDNNK